MLDISEDRALTCRDCATEFIFTVGEQEFYRQKGFENLPTRCKPCREAKKRATLGQSSYRMQQAASPVSSAARTLHPATCSSCGAQTQVPFRPAIGKPVYCRDCYHVRSHRGRTDQQPIML